MRTFKLERMDSIVVGKRFTIDIEADNPILFPFQIGSESFNAKVFIGSELEDRIHAITWEKGHIERLPNGAIWTIEARDSKALASWVLENGPEIMLVEPKCIVHTIEEHLRSILSSLEVDDD